MLRLEDLVKIGYIKKAHGYKGEVRIQIIIQEAEEIETEHVFLEIEGKPVPFFIEELSGPADQWVVKFEGIENEDRARQLVGSPVYFESELLPDLDLEANISVLIGMKVMDKNMGELGIVSDHIEKTGQDLLEMTWNNKLYLLPFASELIEHIDEKKKILFTNLPEGLLELED